MTANHASHWFETGDVSCVSGQLGQPQVRARARAGPPTGRPPARSARRPSPRSQHDSERVAKRPRGAWTTYASSFERLCEAMLGGGVCGVRGDGRSGADSAEASCHDVRDPPRHLGPGAYARSPVRARRWRVRSYMPSSGTCMPVQPIPALAADPDAAPSTGIRVPLRVAPRCAPSRAPASSRHHRDRALLPLAGSLLRR